MDWSEWASYRPADFLMFSPRLYWRLFASVNEAWFPAQLVLGAGLLVAAWRAPRAALGVAALAWALAGYAFLQVRFAPINWPAGPAAVAWYVQAAALALAARVPRTAAPPPSRPAWSGGVGWALLVMGVVVYPLLAAAGGRPWQQAECFGLAPDPTALATLGLLLRLRVGWLAWVLPLGWCLGSGAMLATMGSWQAAVPWLAALAALATRRVTYAK